MTTNAVQNCRWCGGMHPELRCPKVRALEFHPDGTIRRVEFVVPKPLQPGKPGPFDRIGSATSTGARA